ncbi:metallophosphoesterase [Daejeonella oryzae]|uniref:metallophosphoesterase n=1 Tax=Daejeonella oryzae TaxID=1122943 RepID=UPI0005666818|nr:metallophosphoesterase [Daejeonella oryzae]
MQIKIIRSLLIVLSCYTLNACISTKPYYDKSQKNWQSANSPDTLELKYTVFLIGDAGTPENDKQEPVLKLLQSQVFQQDTLMSPGGGADSVIQTSNPKDVVIFLGDNIYETGLPEPTASDRKEKERRITEQMNTVKGFKGQKIIIPGNHDWNEGRPGGLQAINRQEEFVEQYLDSADVFLPTNGCGGPVELQLNDDLVVIVVDSEWWLTKYDKPLAPDNGCTSSDRLDLIQQVQDIVIRNRGKNIVLAQHHPLYSNGRHGGYFTLKDYIFPLTLVRDNYYIPLPVIGSIYPLMRQYGVSRQDLSNKDYQQLKRGLLSVMEDEKNIVIATGHEHALQLNKYKDINHIISGAGSKSTSVIKGNEALFAYGGGGAKGFARLNYYSNGQCWVEFWEPEGDGSTGKIVFRSPLYAIPSKSEEKTPEQQLVSYVDSTKMVVAGSEYKAGNFKRTLFGEHYRDTWATPINVKYLDLNLYAGGLTPLKMGGGKQTTSLQLEGKDGNIYQFRTVDKNPAALLPESFLKTFAEDLVQDQISSAHPYGALMIPDMAKSVGIYHANPQLVYMPYSTLLGPYIQQVGGKLGIIEARPDEDVSDFNSFGNAKNAVSTNKMYKEIQDDNDNEVDQKMFLRARLFDLLIGDWDRHEDQWRWAEFKKTKGTLFRPIPRDRDQAFTKFDGLIPSLISGILPDIQTFGMTIKDPAELSIAARNLDRNLLNKLSKADWLEIASDIQKKLTDEVINQSVAKMPVEVYSKSGPEIIEKLKSRRNQLSDVAEKYYKVLSDEVTVVGTNKKEFFKVERGEKSVHLTVFKIDKNDKIDQKIFDRTFDTDETNELNLFALEGKDSILIEGSSANDFKIRVIGGEGKDALVDNGNGGRTLFYDQSTEDNNVVSGANTALRLSDKAWINEYNLNSFTYDKAGIIPSFDFNADDGLFIGGGYGIKHYGFRKEPYSFDQSISGNYAPKTGAYSIRYNGNFYSIFAPNLDIVVNAAFNGPKYTFNYYGQGNSSLNVGDDIDYFRVRTNNLSVRSFLQYRFTKAFKVGIGPGYEYFRVEKPDNKYVSSSSFPDQEDIIDPSTFLSLRSYAIIDFVNNPTFPGSGVRWKMEGNYMNEIKNSKDRFLQLRSDISFYATPNFRFPVTAAVRIGGATNIGDYKFFQANSLGNNTNLRGFRNNRFSGRSYLYQNSELRFKVSNFRNYIFTGNLGLFGFFDSGRVYSDNPESNEWHKAYGPGVWFNFFNKFLLSTSYGISEEGKYFSFKSGMSF